MWENRVFLIECNCFHINKCCRVLHFIGFQLENSKSHERPLTDWVSIQLVDWSLSIKCFIGGIGVSKLNRRCNWSFIGKGYASTNYIPIIRRKKNLATLTNRRPIELILGFLNRLHFKVPKKTRFEVWNF